MRCLTLARENRASGGEARFMMAGGEGSQAGLIREQGLEVIELTPEPHDSEPGREYARWLRLPWASDAEQTAAQARNFSPDWVVLDHYGLDHRWSERLRKAVPHAGVFAIDDLDDRQLGADIVLDQARDQGRPRRFHVPLELSGHRYAMLRPEFAAAREAALARRGGPVRHVLIAPGMGDPAGLAPRALDAMARFPDMTAEVVMGSDSQSANAVRERVAGNRGWSVTFDARDMAARMSAADFCIGGGGMSSWERCALGLPSLAVPVAENQRPGVQSLVDIGAVVMCELAATRDATSFAHILASAFSRSADLATCAAQVTDGRGATRTLQQLRRWKAAHP